MPKTNGTVPATPAESADRVFLFLRSLRAAGIRIGALVLVCSIAGYYLAEPILRRLSTITGVKLAAYGIPETFFTFLSLALAFGLFTSMPYLLFAVLSGIQPLFPAFSRRMMIGFWCASVALFYAGVFFCLNVSLPFGVKFLLEFEGPNIEALISVRKFTAFSLLFIFGFGIMFEMPLAMILAGRVGFVRYPTLAKNRRYAILAITIISAMLTPTPDAFNLGMMAVPLYILFEAGLIGMRLYAKSG
jgi:sec-independent protein translocase protein TatC